ncbi:MAG: hypothetical protein LPJ89_04470 [Hymenobacteraceae bacterium]|nr:hypothetical protein [Hymenobacteraceae bacterium]MDX5394881.1 hypothetical protein [Hymenobacteraceae bacterium]MDX5443020.1 hypothetical protein [Hymenobacteraceae bacterium]MDX5510915.1 hypothetical protein [Hymenobacteraceae bacterium]
MSAIREDLHKLIDSTEGEQLLENIFMILSSRKEHTEGSLWNSLSPDEQQQVLESESEITNKASWVSNEEMKKRNAKWLK